MKKITTLTILIFAVLFSSIACKPVDDGKIRVYASFYPVYFFASEIAGDKIEVKNISANGGGGHTAELDSKMNIEIQSKASLFIYSGSGMETWADKLVHSLIEKSAKAVIVEASKGIVLISTDDADGEHDHEDEHDDEDDHDHEGHDHEGHDHDHGIYDPHIWTSPKSAIIMLRNIYNAIANIDSANTDFYTENYNRLKTELEELDTLYTQSLLGHNGKTIIVSHNAFGYLCRDYNIKQLATKGVYDEENTFNSQAEIINFIRNNSYINKLYWDSSSESEKTLKSIKEQFEIENRELTLSELSTLENLTKEQADKGENFISIMRQNIINISTGFPR